MTGQAFFGEYFLRQQMLHAVSLSSLQHRIAPGAEPLTCEAKLLNGDLWRSFHDIGTEMIITKGGRRMFPSLRVSFEGLDPREDYCVMLELTLVGRRRWRWAGGAWAAAGGAEPQSPKRLMLHPDSPAPGHHWTANPVSFSKLKLTNNTMDAQGHMVLTSMHKYRPRVLIVRARDAAALAWDAPYASFSFPETEFIAVTAYQNDRITKLKIDNNPFAKGFRACGQSRSKRKSMESEPVSKDKQNDYPEAKRPMTDEASSCSEEGSVQSATPPRLESPLPLIQPLLHMPHAGIWPTNPIVSGLPPYWSPVLPEAIPHLPLAPAPAPSRRLKNFSISSILGDGLCNID